MRRWGSVLVGTAAFAVYASLCAPVSGMGDASELTVALAMGAVPHPTGYPLYIAFGHAFCVAVHGLGANWSLAANLWSAVGAAVAMGALHALALDLAGMSREPAPWWRRLAVLIPVGLFAFPHILMKEAIAAEVNSWGLAWTCGAGYLFIRLLDAAVAGAAPPSRNLRGGAALWGLCVGAGLAHHLTSLWIAAPLSLGLVAALARRRQLEPILPLVVFGAALVPLASYGFIAWRAWHPAEGQWTSLESNWTSVWAHVSGERYRLFLGYFAPSASQRDLLARLGYPFLFPGLALLLLGSVRTATPERRIVWLALTAAAYSSAGFAFFYGVPDPAPYFLPAMALGVAAAGAVLAGLARSGSRAWPAGLLAAALAGLLVVVHFVRDGIEYREGLVLYEQLVRSMWSAVPPEPAIVFWKDDRFMRLREYQILRGEKPALFVVPPEMLFDEPTRRTLKERCGVDPVAGVARPIIPRGTPDEKQIRDRFLSDLMQRTNDRTSVPVILFDPSVPIVRRMPKPWEESGP